jgi:hypothetical protein
VAHSPRGGSRALAQPNRSVSPTRDRMARKSDELVQDLISRCGKISDLQKTIEKDFRSDSPAGPRCRGSTAGAVRKQSVSPSRDGRSSTTRSREACQGGARLSSRPASPRTPATPAGRPSTKTTVGTTRQVEASHQVQPRLSSRAQEEGGVGVQSWQQIHRVFNNLEAPAVSSRQSVGTCKVPCSPASKRVSARGLQPSPGKRMQDTPSRRASALQASPPSARRSVEQTIGRSASADVLRPAQACHGYRW